MSKEIVRCACGQLNAMAPQPGREGFWKCAACGRPLRGQQPAPEPASAARDLRHQAALDVIRRRETDGVPFILYLRDFMRGERTLHRQYRQSDPFTIDNNLMAQVSPHIGIVFIQSEAEEKAWADRPDHEHAPKGPSLRLTGETWKGQAERLIELADVIFVDATILGPGTRFELDCCLIKNKLDHTVVVLRPPNFMRWQQDEAHAQEDDADELVQRFPRVVWSDDLYKQIGNNPVFKDLIDRARGIAAMPREKRMQVRNAGPAALPVTYEGVPDYYVTAATARAFTRQPWHADPWEDNWERTFWSFHRASATMLTMIRLGLVEPRRCAPALVECYRAMVNLLGESNVSERGLVMRGHIDLVRALSGLSHKWARLHGDGQTVRICEEMQREIEERAKLLATKALPYGPILKTLYLPELDQVMRCAREDSARY
jgi:hypothetical protein